MIREITVTHRLLQWHKTHDQADLACFSCGEKLAEGDRAVKRQRNSKFYVHVPKSVFHHKKCFKRF